jgi:hypothetical protein
MADQQMARVPDRTPEIEQDPAEPTHQDPQRAAYETRPHRLAVAMQDGE